MFSSNEKAAQLLTQKELAAMMNCHVMTIRRLHALGLPRVYLGTGKNGTRPRPRYDLNAVQSWLESRAAGKGVEA